MNTERQIEHNIRVHDRMCQRYESLHGEIFNPVEQERLAQTVRLAVSRIRGGRQPARALDVGCGTGNLTRHLLAAGLHVTAADVSTQSLEYLRQKLRGAVTSQSDQLRTVVLNGRNLAGLSDASFDLVAAYSLLHHVPDYLGLVREMVRVLAPGGVFYVDHEAARGFWSPSEEYREYVRLAKPKWHSPGRWQKFLVPRNYWFKVRRLRNKRLTIEGDLHVWPDDHIEWDAVERALTESGCSETTHEEYLLYRRGYDLEAYRQYRTRCADVAFMMGGKV
jgi:ubiquinone/menaquinone biosynthesis C-methylase UbiE